MARGNQRASPAVGDRAPSFQLEDLDGKRRSLEDMLARGPVVLAFYKVSCPVCQFTFPFLERLHKGAGVSAQFVAVSQDDAAASKAFNREYGITFATVLDECKAGYPVSNAFGISHVPTSFLVEKDGTIGWIQDGFSKIQLVALGRRVGAAPFQPGEYVPEWKAG